VTARGTTWQLVGFILIVVAGLYGIWVLENRWLRTRPNTTVTLVFLLSPERSLGPGLEAGKCVDAWNAADGTRVAERLTVVNIDPAKDGKRFVHLRTARARAGAVLKMKEAVLVPGAGC
jgi:hypothetical protein